MSLKEKIQKLFEPETLFEPEITTLEKYKMVFTTIDGKTHEFNRICYADPSTLSCSIGEYYLIGEDYLRDDEGVLYPRNNVLSIKFVLTDTVNNVIKKYYGSFSKTYYQQDEIEFK